MRVSSLLSAKEIPVAGTYIQLMFVAGYLEGKMGADDGEKTANNLASAVAKNTVAVQATVFIGNEQLFFVAHEGADYDKVFVVNYHGETRGEIGLMVWHTKADPIHTDNSSQ